MTLKINYLDKKKVTSKNKAFFVGSINKIAEFGGEIDNKTFKNILDLKKGKNLKDDKIIYINQNLDQKIVLIYDVKAGSEMEYEKLGAKFFDFLKKNEIHDIQIITPKKYEQFFIYHSFMGLNLNPTSLVYTKQINQRKILICW